MVNSPNFRQTAVPEVILRGETCGGEARAQEKSWGVRSVMRSQEGLIPRKLSLSKEAANAGATWPTGFATTPGASA
jgi:hypothetical protein